MATRTKKPTKYSEAELQKMAEPITVVLKKIVAGKESPIELPPGPGEQIGGMGYDKDMIRQLPPFIAKTWSGGGMYKAELTDTTGMALEMEIYFHPSQVPERTPPGLQGVQPQVQAQPQAVPPPPAHNPNYLQQVASTYPQGPQVQPQYASGVQPVNNPWAWQPPGAGISSPVGGIGNGAAQKEREERLRLEAKLERVAQQNQHEKEMTGIGQELRRMQEQMTKNPNEESATTRAALQEIESLKQQNSTQVITQQMDRMQQNFMQMMERQQANTDKQIEEMRRLVVDGSASKTDPMMTMMMQQSQTAQQAQAQQQQMLMQVMTNNQTSQLEAARLAQSSQMTPRDMADLFRQANTGADQMASAYGKAWDLMATGMESIMQAQGPGVHPALAMIGQGVEGGLGMAARYMEMKESEQQNNAQARVHQANLEAQTRVKTAMIQADAAKTNPLPPAMQESQESPTELNGAGEGEGEVEVVEAPEETPAVAPADIKEVEKALFGPAYDAVMRLRLGVEKNLVDEATTADAILKAIEHFSAQDEMPKVFDLWAQQQFPEFVNALMPDAHHQFREAVTTILIDKLNKMAA